MTLERSDYFAVHAHSHYSWLDGMGTVESMVQRVVDLGQPALALTDHGVMSGCIRLYKECRKHDVEPLPGSEFYVVMDREDKAERERRYHVGLLALDAKGYEALVGLSSYSHFRQNFHRKPLVTLQELLMFGREHGEHVALTTGCFFSLPVQTLCNSGYDAALRIVSAYAQAFPHTFVELQNHGVADNDHDDSQIVMDMLRIADEVGLPVVAGQDSHYCEHDHKQAHDLMKRISYHGNDGDDFTFPGDGFHMADASWVADHYTPMQWERIEEGHGALLDLSNVRLPDLENYRFHVPSVHSNPDARLKKLAERGLHMHHFDVFDTYERRLKHELDVIQRMGFSDYFLLVVEATDWMTKNGVLYNVRGSANGSLVCYVLGITHVDPIEWNTDFSRFLSLDRQKPPDIDIDVESEMRESVITHLRTQFKSIVHIGTYNKLGVHLDLDTGEEKGSLFRQYASAKSRTDSGFHGYVESDDRAAFDMLDDQDVFKSPGTHAGGLVLPGHDLPIERLLATMLIASSNTTVTQAPMDDVEDAGYVKLDLLGLRALTTIRNCMQTLGMTVSDMRSIRWNDSRTCKLLSSGKTVGVFQFEGASTWRGAKRMGIGSTMDAVYALALFRPALLNGGQTERFLAARDAGRAVTVPSLVTPILEPTLGVAVFQEQVIDILRSVSMPEDELNSMLKAVKASNHRIGAATEVMAQIRPRFLRLAMSKGCTKSEAKAMWGIVAEFTDYGFNRAHATSYGHMSYRAAFLKAHYPNEFIAATLNTWAGTPKERLYIKEARRLGLSTVKPDVNESGVKWTLNTTRRKPSIQRGLLTVPGVGLAAAESIVEERESGGPFTSVEDMIERLPARPVSGGKNYAKTGELTGVYAKLLDAGALRSILDM